MQQRQHLLTLSKGMQADTTNSIILWFGGSCLSVVVLPTSLNTMQISL